MMRELYLVRHGHCEQSGRLLGQIDIPLTEKGIAQAQALAEQLAGCGVERVISSDLQRAAETARPVARSLGIALELDARLREISYGEWDGRSWGEIEQADPEAARRKLEDWNGQTPPGGEAFADFLARVQQAWESIRTSGARVTVVVAHRGVNAVLLAAASGSGCRPFQQDYGTVRRVRLP